MAAHRRDVLNLWFLGSWVYSEENIVQIKYLNIENNTVLLGIDSIVFCNECINDSYNSVCYGNYTPDGIKIVGISFYNFM